MCEFKIQNQILLLVLILTCIKASIIFERNFAIEKATSNKSSSVQNNYKPGNSTKPKSNKKKINKMFYMIENDLQLLPVLGT